MIAIKLDATGSALLFSSLIGGSEADFGRSLDVDMVGNMLIVGQTYSPDYPIANAMQDDCGVNCADGMMTKITDIPDAP